MPKLLQINAAKNCGSTGKIAEQISLLAQEYGWDSYIAHGNRYDRGGSIKSILVTDKYGEYKHALKSLFLDAHGLGSTIETKRFIRTIESLNPDLIHLHNLHGYYINYEILFKYLRYKQIPVVWTLHDCWPFTGHCVYFDRIGCDKWKNKCYHCPQKDSYPKSIVDMSSRNYNQKKTLFTSLNKVMIVPVSDWLHNLVAESFLGIYSIKTIHNGIDLEKFKPCKSDFRQRYGLEGKFVVLGVADGFGLRKGLKDFNMLSEELGEDVEIVMVGLSEEDTKQITSKVTGFCRTANQQELIDIYSEADVFVNPTYEDNFPTTNLEALACGTPVITYRTGGSPEAIDEKTGIVVRKGDFEALSKAIISVKNKGKLFYSKACRERALKYFNKDNCFKNYIELYNKLSNK